MRIPWRGEDRAATPHGAETPTRTVVPSLGNGVTAPFTQEKIHELVEGLRSSSPASCETEFLADWMGVRTRIPMLPWAPAELAGTTSTALPIPDDGYRSEAGEYAALAYALETAQETFRMVEVGAGWAPWAVAGVVAARRRGLQAQACAVEADPTKVQWALTHAQDNDCTTQLVTGTVSEILDQLHDIAHHGATVDVVVVNAACWHQSGPLHFPEIDAHDMGGAVWTLEGTDVDYRGAHVQHREVPGIALANILTAIRGRHVIDLLHIDVQGVEYELLSAAAAEVQDVTRLLMIGTHSRLSEGQLQYFWLERGWGLLHDDPCTGHFTMTHPTLAGFTVQDGNQFWENPFLLR